MATVLKIHFDIRGNCNPNKHRKFGNHNIYGINSFQNERYVIAAFSIEHNNYWSQYRMLKLFNCGICPTLYRVLLYFDTILCVSWTNREFYCTII